MQFAQLLRIGGGVVFEHRDQALHALELVPLQAGLAACAAATPQGLKEPLVGGCEQLAGACEHAHGIPPRTRGLRNVGSIQCRAKRLGRRSASAPVVGDGRERC